MTNPADAPPPAPPLLQSGVRFWTRRGGAFFLVDGIASWEAGLWDSGEVRDELNHIADAGFTFVRVVVPWDVLQPDPTRLRTALIDRLIILLDACAEAKLTLHLSVAGNLGGTFFVPRWVVPTEPLVNLLRPTLRVVSDNWESPLPLRNLYEDEAMLAGQAWLWGELSRHLAAHKALGHLEIGFGGVLSMLTPRHPEFALRWWERVRDTHAERTPTWAYSDSLAYLYQDGVPTLKMWRDTVGTFDLALPVQGTEANGSIAYQDTAFRMLLAQSLARGAVGCAAFGIATSTDARHNLAPPTLGDAPDAFRLATEEAQADAFAALLPMLHALGIPSLCHTVWADAPPPRYATPPYDRYLPLRHAGLLRADGREKEALRIWRQFHATTAQTPLPDAPPRFDLDEAEWRHRRSETGFVEGLKRDARL